MHQPYPGPPPKKGGALKWILGGVALLAVIAVTVVLTITLGGRDNNGNGGAGGNTASGSDSEFASANDTGPVTIITEDPTCAAWIPINNTLADAQKNGWLDRDPSIPATSWSPELRRQYQEVGQALTAAADQTEPLVKLTPHRVVRELYTQFNAYARAYADAIPNYNSPHDQFARTAGSTAAVLSGLCTAAEYGSGAARAPLVPEAPAPSNIAPAGDPAQPTRFLTEPDSVCPDWESAANEFIAHSAAWRRTPSDVPAGQWSDEQKKLTDEVVPVMRESADTFASLGQRSGNPILQDFALLVAQYRRAFVQALPTYRPADKYLFDTTWRGMGMVASACKAAEIS
ncbi:hypothetical protein [[Mycobacterium] fortunisiensis]|nr:hypothetical protein [[Mycobacterium] fortunisiensis]